jgi:hypothetical protein
MDLKTFRSQYPQYNSVPDQQLVDGLHGKFYSQLPKDEFYNRIGFAPPAPEAPAVTQEVPTPEAVQPEAVQPEAVQEAPAVQATQQAPTAEQPAPGMFDRVLNFLNQPVPVSDADKLIAGSLKKGFKQLGEIPAQIQYAELSGLQNAREAQYGKNLENAPPEVKARHQETAKELQRLQEEAALAGVERKAIETEYGVNPLAKKLEKISSTPEYQEGSFWDKTKQYGGALLDNAKDIPGYIGTLGLESLPASSATIATALLTRGLTKSNTLAAASAGGTSGFIEFGNNYADMREKGMSHEEAWEKAAVKSGVIGFFDAVSFGSAGKAANEIMKKVEQGAALAAAKQTIKGSTIQGAYGAAGEGGGSAVIGEELDPIKMGAEFAGEFFLSPLEGAGAYAGYKQAAQQAKTAEQPKTDRDAFSSAAAKYQSMMAEAQKFPEGSVESQEATQRAFDFFETEVSPLLEARIPVETPEVPPLQGDITTSTAPGIEVSYARERTEPTFITDPETGEILNVDPETGEVLPVGDLNVDRTRTGVDAGRTEPSISMPVEGAATTQGVTPSDTSGLVAPVGGNGRADAGKGAERTALDESLTPTPTEPAPAATYAELPAEDKAPVLQEAQQMWQAGEANLPIAKAWNSLPSWKRDMFAAQVYENYDEITTNPEAFRAAMDKVVEAKKPAEAKAEVTTPATTTAEVFDAAYFKKEFTRLKNKVSAAEKVERRAEMGPDKTAAEQKLAKANQELDAFRAKQDPLLKAAVDKTIAESEEREAKRATAATTPAAPVEKKETVPTMQEMQDAGFTSYEIENLKKDYWPERYRQIKEGYKYIAGEFKQVTQADVDMIKQRNQRNQVLKTEAKEKMDKAFAEDPNAGVSNILGSDWNSSNWSTQTPEQYQKAAYAALDRKYGFLDSGVAILESRLAAANKANGVKETPTAPKRGRPAKPKVEGEQKTPKPRGRKKIELTPEEQAFKDAERGVSQAEANKGSRDVDKLIKFLSSEFDPANPKSPEFTKVVTQGLDPVRREYIYKLHEFATKNAYRTKPASGGKARDFLANSDKITQKERADLQTRLNFEKTRPPKPSAARRKTEGKPIQAFYRFNNATQAIEYVMRTGTPFERTLAARLKPFVSDVSLVIADTQENTPNSVKDDLTDAAGVYVSRQYGDKIYRMIVLRGENFDDPDNHGLSNVIFLHEALHAATEAKIYEAQELTDLGMPVPDQLKELIDELLEIRVAALTRYEQLKASGAPISPNLRHKFEKLNIAFDPKEFVAYGMTDPEIQQFLMDTPGRISKDQAREYFKNLFNRFVNSLRRAFNIGPKDQSAFQDLMLVTEGLLQEQEIEPAYSVNTELYTKKQTAVDNLRKKLSSSFSATQNNASTGKLMVETRNVDDALRLLRATYAAMDVGKMRLVLPTLTTDDITRWAGNRIKNLRKVNEAVDAMAGMRTKMIRDLAEKIPAWVMFNKKHEEGGKLLGDVMHASTLKNVDPTLHANVADALLNDPLIKKNTALLKSSQVTQAEARTLKRQQTQRTNEITEVYKIWNKLAKYGNREGHRIYAMAKKSYADTFELHEKLLQQKIDASKLPDDQKQKLLSSITKMFQDAKRLGVYFPLMRYGNFWFSVGKGPSGEFYMFESAIARNNFEDLRIAELQAAGDTRSKKQMKEDRDIDTGDQLDGQRESVVESSKMLKDVFGLLESGNISDIDAVKDQIYQMYLMTLPDRDIRKKFTHRQGKTGFSADVIRNFVTSQHTAANQLARLAHAEDVRNGIDQAYAELAGNPDKLKLSTFVDEIALRANAEVTPRVVEGIDWNKYASIGNQIVFFYMLTSPKSALVQMTQLPIVVLPVQTAKYGASVVKVVARYSNIFRMLGLTKKDSDGNVITKWGQPSINDSMYIRNIKDPEYKAALTEAWNTANDRDIFMSTYAADMSARSRSPTEKYQGATSRAFRNAGNFISGAFHHMERMTREITYMSTFELEYAKARKEGLSSKEATERGIKAGIDMTYESLFNYTEYNKPRVMKHPIGRISFQFMTYPLQMTSFLVRNFYSMLPYLNKQDKREAAIKFFGVIGMTTMFAGVVGLPGYSMIMGLAEGIREMLRDEDDEDYDEDDDGNPLGKRSLDLWFREWFLPTYFGEESSLAAALNLTPAQAELLTRSVKLGPIPTLTDINIGSSVSLDGLWFRNDNPEKTSKGAFEQMAYDYAFGPLGSMASQLASAFDEWNNGQFNRAIETSLPAFARGAATAVRLGTEGAKSRKGEEVMNAEFYTTGKLLAQALGAGSTEVADIQKANFMAKKMVLKIETERQNILTNLDVAMQRFDNNPTDATEKMVEKIYERIEKYNAKNGMLAITGETIANSMAAREKTRTGSFQGLSVTKSQAPFVYPLVEKGRSQGYK